MVQAEINDTNLLFTAKRDTTPANSFLNHKNWKEIDLSQIFICKKYGGVKVAIFILKFNF